MTSTSATAQGGLTARWQSVMMNNYGTPPLALVRGNGAEVWDADGNRYLDLVAGIAVNSLGHAHPAVVEAVTKQISTMGHVSNLYLAEPPIELAERLIDLLGVAPQGARALFCNSGAEALEAAFKMSRRTGRTKLVAAQNAFHGRTMGALALTGQEPKRAPFAPLPAEVTHVPYGDVDALDKKAFDKAYGKRVNQPGYLWYLDYNANDRVWAEDLALFLLNYGHCIRRR